MNKILIIAFLAVAVLSLVIYQLTLEFDDESKKDVISIHTKNPNAIKILELCDTDKHCIVEALWSLAKQEKDDAIVFTAADEIMANFQQAGFYCHQQGHHVGLFLYSFTQDLSKSLSLADRKCGGSIYHGIVENYFMTEVLFEGANVEEIDIADSCNQLLDDSKSMIYLECVHGVGHGLAKSYDYDVFSAVKRCDEFETGEEEAFCNQGVFMENVVEYHETGGGTFDENDLLYPCNQLDSKYAQNCYHYHSSYLFKNTNSASEVFQQCDKINDEEQIQSCYVGVGGQISASLEKMEEINRHCQLGDPKYQNLCFIGVVLLVADQFGLDEAFKTCQLFPEKFKQGCYLFMGSWISKLNLTSEQIDEECKKAEDLKYYKDCLKLAFN